VNQLGAARKIFSTKSLSSKKHTIKTLPLLPKLSQKTSGQSTGNTK
jgi:hypothetical protein